MKKHLSCKGKDYQEDYEITSIDVKKMNAYELADELKGVYNIYCEDAAKMLRQQADKIAKLEKQLMNNTKLIYDKPTCDKFSSAVRIERFKRNITQQQFADLLGVSRSTLVRLENGKPPLKIRLCEAAMELIEKGTTPLKDNPLRKNK